MRPFLLVALGGALGATVRYAAGLLAVRWFGPAFPWATIAVNIAGSLLLGWLLAETHRYGISDATKLVVGTGICGALTTFSTFGVESLRLLEQARYPALFGYLAANLLLGFGAAALGLRLGSA